MNLTQHTMEENIEFEIVPGKKINSNMLYMREEKFLYTPINKVKGAQRYKCIEPGCSGGLTLSNNTITRSKKSHFEHLNHEGQKHKFCSIQALKTKCKNTEEIFSNEVVSTRAIFDKHLIRLVLF